MKNYYTSIVFAVLIGWFSNSVAQNYTVVTTNEAYIGLQAPTLINNPLAIKFADVYYAKIPFKFTLFNREINFDLGNGITVYRDAYVVDENEHGLVMEPFYAALKKKDSTSTISYELTGVVPNRILKFQWGNMGLRGNAATDFVNVQLWLHERNNIISVHVGSQQVTSTTAFIGGNGLGPEIGLLRYDPNTQSFPEKQELIGDPSNPTLINDVNRSLDGVPAEGTVYTFSPPGVSVAVNTPENSLLGINIFPNPASSIVYIQMANSMLSVEVYDVTGKWINVPRKQIANGVALDVSSLAKGVYQCKVTQDGQTTFHKVVVSD